MDTCSIIDILKGLLTPLIALIAVWIAYQQRTINKNKLKLDLFEKRYDVYINVSFIIATALSHGNLTDSEITDFRRNTARNIFLFKEDVTKHIDEIASKANELQKLELQLQYNPKDEVADKREVVFTWFKDQINRSENIFSKYLRIEDT